MELNEVVVQLVKMVGVSNFILIIVVIAIVINLPTLLSKLISTFSSNKKGKEMQQMVGLIKTKLIDFSNDSNEIKKDINEIKNVSHNNSNNVEELKKELKSVNTERREENMMIIDTMEDMLKSILSIKNIMKNVMSEEDAIRLISYLLGVFKGFAGTLLEKVMNTMESFDRIDDHKLNEKTLKSDMDNCWSDLKIEISRFNTPIKLKPLLDSYDDQFWAKDGMYTQIIKLSTLESDIKIIKESIKKQIDIGLRVLFNNISESFEKNKS